MVSNTEVTGRSLTAAEETILKENSLTMEIVTRLHLTNSMSYGGRNKAVMQRTDAANPISAIEANVNAYRQSLLGSGYSNQDIDNAIKKLSAPFVPQNTMPNK